MKTYSILPLLVLAAVTLSSCSTEDTGQSRSSADSSQRALRVMRTRPLDPVVRGFPKPRTPEQLAKIPLYRFNEAEIDAYLGALDQEGGVRGRLVHLARKNIGQPYEIFCLGEFPFETYDPDPLYCLQRSDCVTFTEQMYAMALSRGWKGFFKTLLRIRYKNGEVGVASRNHYTEADWNLNNAWLLEDLTEKLGAETDHYSMKVDRSRNLRKQFGVELSIPVQIHEESFIPVRNLDAALGSLEDGDVVEVVKGKGDGRWVGHVGLFVRGPAGEPHFLHSSAPKVKEESLPGYAARMKGRVFGFKFLRLRPELR